MPNKADDWDFITALYSAPAPLYRHLPLVALRGELPSLSNRIRESALSD
jgi:hypothetical protein